MKYLFLLFLFSSVAQAINVNANCSSNPTNGTITSGTTSPRVSGISPLVVFFDSTGTTDTAVTGTATVFENDYFSWNFGDTLSSGTGTWAYGSNPGNNIMNFATGAVAAHLYKTEGRDTLYTATVTIQNLAGNIVKCGIGVQVFDPNGANGWPGAATTCYSTSGNFTGCPTGATHTTQSTIPSLAIGNKRLLFRCGEIFTGLGTVSGTKSYMGAYGGCENTTVNRPTLRASGASDQLLLLTNPSQDIRIVDLVLDAGNFNGGGGNDREAITDNQTGGSINAGNKPVQYTFYNINTINHGSSLRWNASAQMAVVNSVLDVPNQPASGNCPPPYTNCSINLFVNIAGNGTWSTSGPIPNEDFSFFAGNKITNVPNKSLETMRDSYASKHIIINNTMHDAGPSYANLKLHDICFATNGGTGAFCGIYSQFDIVADNDFGGASGANMVEVAPQNNVTDERMRFIVFERNLLDGTATFGNGRMLELSGTNITVRSNVCPNLGITSSSGNLCVSAFQTGIEPAPTALSVYNNTCGGGGNSCIGFGGFGLGNAPTNSIARNNLAFNTSGLVTVANSGTGNTISNNSSNTTLNPAFVNGSGTLSLITDFKPTANFSGALNNVPVFYDATGGGIPAPYGTSNPWSPNWDLGAVHH